MRPLYLGLWNTYRGPFSEPHRRAILRAANLCEAFSFNLATFGFGKKLKKIMTETSIGKGGIENFFDSGRFYEFDEITFPPQLGKIVATTKTGNPHSVSEIKRWLERSPVCFIFGLGPHGLPKDVIEKADDTWDFTGKNYSLETATAMGVAAGKLSEIQFS